MEDQVQKAVDCYNAGATVLHLHARELDGKGSKRLSKFNELIAGVREAVPDMIIQVGGSISFSPETEGEAAKWLSDDTRHMLAELTPKPDQVTLAINTNQFNIIEAMLPQDVVSTSFANPVVQQSYREMISPAGPTWVEEHIRRLTANGIQIQFQIGNINSLETVERMMRRGVCNVPLILTWIPIGGGADAMTPYNMANFLQAVPDGAVLTFEAQQNNVLPLNMMAIALGQHVRLGIEDTIWWPDRSRKMTSVEQIEQIVRIAKECARPVATAKEARKIYKIGTFYNSIEETLEQNGFAPNRAPARPFRQAAE
jgi:uncharacterized protein (DUF849 family)